MGSSARRGVPSGWLCCSGSRRKGCSASRCAPETFGARKWELLHYFPPVHLCSFVLGIAGGHLWLARRGSGPKALQAWFQTALAAAAVVLALQFPHHLQALSYCRSPSARVSRRCSCC
ncbi:MAG: hypothetical protein R3F17_03740 [Planctomycetota bacterium]